MFLMNPTSCKKEKSLVEILPISPSQCTLTKKILLCPMNWGTQWTMKISSNE